MSIPSPDACTVNPNASFHDELKLMLLEKKVLPEDCDRQIMKTMQWRLVDLRADVWFWPGVARYCTQSLVATAHQFKNSTQTQALSECLCLWEAWPGSCAGSIGVRMALKQRCKLWMYWVVSTQSDLEFWSCQCKPANTRGCVCQHQMSCCIWTKRALSNLFLWQYHDESVQSHDCTMPR